MSGGVAMEERKFTVIQKEIIKVLSIKGASYALPVTSGELGETLNVTPSYIREQAKVLERRGVLAVRRGPGGGYFININN